METIDVNRHGKVNIIPSSHIILKQDKKLEYLVRKVSEHSRVDITTPNRKRENVYLRAIYYKLAIELTPYSYVVIGKKCDRDHTTVTHSMKVKWPEIKTYRPDLIDLYEQILLDLDDSDFADLKVLRMENDTSSEISKLKKTIANVKAELDKDYFSLKQKLVNIHKVAYNKELD